MHEQITSGSLKLFLAGDVMIGRGVDQILTEREAAHGHDSEAETEETLYQGRRQEDGGGEDGVAEHS